MKTIVIIVLILLLAGIFFFAPVVRGREVVHPCLIPPCPVEVEYLTLFEYLTFNKDKSTKGGKLLPPEDGEVDTPGDTPPDSGPINSGDFQTIDQGAYSGLEMDSPRRLAVKNNADWRELWFEHNKNREPLPPRPTIDFSRQTVFAVSTGERSTGGSSIEIINVRDVGSRVEVYVHTTSQGKGCMVTTAFSHPYHIVSAPVSGKEVVFVDTSEIVNCN